MTHYTAYNNFTEAFVAFGELARSCELNVGMSETQDTLVAALQGLWPDKALFKYACASIMCTGEDDIEKFENIFKIFWGQKGNRIIDRTVHKNKSNIAKSSLATLVMTGTSDKQVEKEEETKSSAGSNKSEVLRKTDFANVSDIDSEYLDALCKKLVKEMSLRIRRKRKKAIKGQIEIAQTIRKSIQNGGNFFQLVRKNKKVEKFRIVALLDVSGSMDKYSFYLLKFLCILKDHFDNVETFIFSTKMMRITDFLKSKNIKQSLFALGQNADHWSSGTEIGKCLEQFNNKFAKKCLNGKVLTIILSDGLDTGKPEFLHEQLVKIKRRTRKLVWLNPLKAMPGYAPIQKGMKAALPNIDEFRNANNLESLLELENILAHA